ncbi:MAG: TolC family protein [Acidobacteriota bacterium]
MTKPFSHAGYRWTALLVSLCLLIALPAAGEPRTVTTTVERLDLEAPFEASAEAVDLRLDQLIEMALERNLGLVIERYDRNSSLLNALQNLGIYDLNFGGLLSTSSSTSPVTSALTATSGPETRDLTQFQFSLSQLTPWGGTARVQFSGSEFESNDLNTFINPTFNAGAELRYTQPLLRGFGKLATDRNILLARINGAVSLEDFELQVASVIRQVSDTYWNLVEAREQLAVAQESLELAEELHEMNRIQVEVGTLPPLDLVQSEAGVAAREEDIIAQAALVEDNADTLRQLINLPPGELWMVPIRPATEPEIEFVEIDLGKALATAYAERADLRRQQLVNETLEVDARFFEELQKPSLELEAVYGLSGVGGDLRDPSTGNVIAEGGFGDAVEQVTDAEFDNWSLQLTLSYPLQNREARARSVRADIAVEQGQVTLEQLRRQILIDVRQAARSVETQAKRIESAGVSSELERRNLEAEQKRYENGLSTSFRVLEIQEDLAQARSREVSAVIGYRKALTAFLEATGQLLETYGVTLESAATGETVGFDDLEALAVELDHDSLDLLYFEDLEMWPIR